MASDRPVVATAHPCTDVTQAIQTPAVDPVLLESWGGAGYLYAHAHSDSGAKLGWFGFDLSGVIKLIAVEAMNAATRGCFY